MFQKIKKLIFIGLLFTLFGCKENPSYRPTYVHKNSSKKTLTLVCSTLLFYDLYQHLTTTMNKNLKNVQLKLVAAPNYDIYISKMNQRAYDIIFVNGLAAMKAQKNGYTIIGKFGDDSSYYSKIFVNKDSGINTISDLKGKKFAVVSRGSVVGELAPLVFLQQNGLNVYKDLNLEYFSSFETGILNVYLGKCDAGCSWPITWDLYIKSHPEILDKVEVKWRTNSFPNIFIIMKNDIDPKISKEVVNELFRLPKYTEGELALKKLYLSNVVKVDSTDCTSLLKLKEEFDQLKK